MNTRAKSLLIAMLGAAIAIFAIAAPAPRATAASAAACTTTSGVTVIVDFTHFNGNIERGCATGQTANALAALGTAGFASAGTTNYGDAFLCRIEGLPLPKAESCSTTPPAKSSWSFYTAHATDAAWAYSTTGVLSTHPAAGTIIAFAFGNRAQPGILPSAAIVTEQPTSTTRPAAPATTTAPTRPPTTTRSNPPVKGQGPTPTTAARGSTPTTSAGDPNAPTTTRPASVTSTTKAGKVKPAKPKPARSGSERKSTRSVPTSTTVAPHVIDKVASGPAARKSSGSPFAVVLTVALVAMLGVGAVINIRDRRRRTA